MLVQVLRMRAAEDQNDLNIEGIMLNISRSVFCKDLWLVVRRLDLSAQRRTPPPPPRSPLSPSQQDATEARAEPTCGSQLHTSDWIFTYNLQLGNSWSIHLA